VAQRRNRDVSPSLTEIAEGLQASEGDGHGTLVCTALHFLSVFYMFVHLFFVYSYLVLSVHLQYFE
jgi:hypothetical protein